MSLCSCCGRLEAFFVRGYSGERLCKRCFVKSVEDKVRATVSRFGMLRFDDRVAVAVSGGKDSTSLLRVLVGLERSFPRAELVGVSVDCGACPSSMLNRSPIFFSSSVSMNPDIPKERI